MPARLLRSSRAIFLTGASMNGVRKTGCGLALGWALLLFAGPGSPAQDLTKDNAQAKAQGALWTDEKWPFPIDQWGNGLAFQCAADKCGSETRLYLRAKIGFCRCATGVSDDDEIDRVGDLELIGADYKPLAPGHAVAAGVMTGRARLFAVARPFQPSQNILTIALANKCDAIVATIMTEADLRPEEINALDFLRSARVQQWAEAQYRVE
jgi:hypothetical protein